MTAATDHVPLRIKLFHGTGSITYGVKDNGFSAFLLLFYNQVIGLDARLVSLALMLALFVDAIADPIIGHLSDRTYTKWGKRLPWLYIAPIPLGFAWILLWAAPASLGGWIFLYLLLIAILVRVLVSCCEVPSASLIPELTRDYDERTVIMRYRYLFGWAGGLVMLFLGYIVFLVPDAEHPVGLLNETGYWHYGLVGGAMMATAMLISAGGQHKRVAHWPDKRPKKTSLYESFHEIREALTHKAALILFGAGAVAYINQGMTFTISNYLFLYVWKFSQPAFFFYPIVLFGSVVGSFFLVTPLTKAFGKRAVAIVGGLVGMIFWIIPFAFNLSGLWPEVGGQASTTLVFGFTFLATTANVVTMITSQSMVADIVEASEIETGRRTEGVFSAGWFFVQKCGTGIGIFCAGLIVSLSGVPDKAQPGEVALPVIENLMIFYALIVLVLSIAGALIFYRFPINRDDHEARVAALAAARSTKDQ
ncbi:MFS transporter [Parasphingorhabdus sp.]|uniref:MFS transporter n=1 Tax=Parasphingorhabdus sp. TaxID=2709688 RepID=UPI003A8CB914